SCTITLEQVTSNKIGEGMGEVSGKDHGIKNAADAGRLNKISTIKVRYSAVGEPKTTVTGSSNN
ncbi:MAG: hypothetical protein ABEH43_04450, partial [Flavobacteriales bacterium]